jgi:hypothetical protein
MAGAPSEALAAKTPTGQTRATTRGAETTTKKIKAPIKATKRRRRRRKMRAERVPSAETPAPPVARSRQFAAQFRGTATRPTFAYLSRASVASSATPWSRRYRWRQQWRYWRQQQSRSWSMQVFSTPHELAA